MPQDRRGSPSGPTVTTKTTVELAHGDVTAASVKEVTATVAGLRTTDLVVVNAPSTLPATLGVSGARVSAANTVAVKLTNPTAGAITAGTNTWSLSIQRFTV